MIELAINYMRSLPQAEKVSGTLKSHSNFLESALYVGMAHPAPPPNTNFQILLIRLLKALYNDLPV